jgi:hypothetical protein
LPKIKGYAYANIAAAERYRQLPGRCRQKLRKNSSFLVYNCTVVADKKNSICWIKVIVD